MPSFDEPVVEFNGVTRRGHGPVDVIEVPAPWRHNLVAAARGIATDTVAFTALPFDRSAPARLLVPQRCETDSSDLGVLDDPSDSVDRIDSPPPISAPGLPSTAPPASASGATPASPAVVDDVDRRAWTARVVEATDDIAAGRFEKVVLGRGVRVERPALSASRLFVHLRRAAPHAYRFFVDGLVGASPELLVARRGSRVSARPMAGTARRTGDRTIDAAAAQALMASSKNRAEHRITIDMVHQSLLPWCSYLDEEPEPSIVDAGPVQHLATSLRGHLSSPPPSILDLVVALHPTPAVGGWPVADALAGIGRLEPEPRGPFAGAVGWFDANGDGEFAVALRSAHYGADGSARVWAGVGIVGGSSPDDEYAEVEAKLSTILGHLLTPTT